MLRICHEEGVPVVPRGAGTSLAGGAGSYTGTALGAIALVLLQSVLTTLNLEFWGRQVIFGVTLLLLMLMYGRQSRLRV